jgi:hypothetical protein
MTGLAKMDDISRDFRRVGWAPCLSVELLASWRLEAVAARIIMAWLTAMRQRATGAAMTGPSRWDIKK